MKELDKTKKYDLSKLTDEQFYFILDKTGYTYISEVMERGSLYYHNSDKKWIFCTLPFKQDLTITCATELFEDEREIIKNPYLTYEEKENILNYKPMTEEEKELWLFVYKESVKYQQSILSHKDKADHAVKDFREALKM